MLHKRYNRYDGWTCLSVLLFALYMLLAGCTREEAVGYALDADSSTHSDGNVPAGSVMLRVGLPSPVQRNVNTRAVATDFDMLNDLNIVIADGSGDDAKILSCIYFRSADVQDGESVVGGSDLVVYNKLSGDDGNAFSVHFSKKWLEYMGISSDNVFFLVGNYGRQLENGEIANVGTLRNLQDRNGTMPGWVNEPCILFGESVENGTHSHTDGTEGKSLSVEMKRTVAMITVAIDGSGLADGVVITPTEVSLHNVPAACRFGVDNQITVSGSNYVPVDPSAVTADGEYKSEYDLGWGSVASEKTINLLNGLNARPVVGGHYCKFDESGNPDYSSLDYTNEDIKPVFMYENRHAAGFGETTNTDPRYKRPKGIASSVEAINAATKSCSYLEVKARYMRFNNKGVIQVGGSVVFRVFLGNNLEDNFDIVRNSYYSLTLVLAGNAVKESGTVIDNAGNLTLDPANVTWRMSSSLSKLGLVGDADIIVGGNGEMITIEFDGPTKSQMIFQFLDKDGNLVEADAYEWEPFVFVEESSKNGNPWYSLDEFNGNFQPVINAAGHYPVYLYVQPMIRDITWKDKGPDEHIRTVTFRVATKSTPELTHTDWITVTQYEPIQLEINDSSPEDVKRYAIDKLQANLPVTIYVDRIDRELQPWGFDGQEIRYNKNTGFDNVYHVIDPEDTNDPLCKEHMDRAMYYLPFGLAYNDNGILDYTRGSCMMHAAFMNSVQQWIAPQTPNGRDQLNGVSTESIVARKTLPPRPGTDPGQNPDLCFAWIIPSIAEWQLMEKMDKFMPGGLFDPAYPVLSAFPYWTSNAGSSELQDGYPQADGKTYAFAYQMNHNLDMIKEGELYPARYLMRRTTPLRYRLIAVKPNVLGGWK